MGVNRLADGVAIFWPMGVNCSADGVTIFWPMGANILRLGAPLNWRVGQRHWPMGVKFGAWYFFFVSGRGSDKLERISKLSDQVFQKRTCFISQIHKSSQKGCHVTLALPVSESMINHGGYGPRPPPTPNSRKSPATRHTPTLLSTFYPRFSFYSRSSTTCRRH